MPHSISAAPGDELNAEQSVPFHASVSRELQECYDPYREAKEVLVKRVKAAIESGDQNLLFAAYRDN